jgi:hypothetical protein
MAAALSANRDMIDILLRRLPQPEVKQDRNAPVK